MNRVDESIGTKGVSEFIGSTAATNDVSRLGVVWKDNNPLTARTTDLLHHDCNEPRPFFPQPEGKPGSKRTVDDVTRPSSLSNL